ncbi:MAG: hypothetical protein LBE24_04145 [Methylobacillus sp.]|jgi:hypothetical protein|nr:hypothetical protein [Methylobacillus sp.]
MWPFSLFKKQAKTFPDLHFNGAEEAIQYAANYLKCDVIEGAVLPCIVDDVSLSSFAGWIASIRLPTSNGIMTCVALPPKNYPSGFYNDLKGKLCAAIIGPKPGFIDSPPAVILVASLLPTLTSDGWKVAWMWESRE